MPEDLNPLTDEHCQCLDQVLDSIAVTQQLLEKCRSCGVDVSAFESRNAEQRKMAESLKRTFFPDRI